MSEAPSNGPGLTDLESRIFRVLRADGTIAACWHYRVMTNASLAEAKEFVLSVASRTEGLPGPGRVDWERIFELVEADRRAEAIQYYSELTGVSPEEADELIENMESQ